MLAPTLPSSSEDELPPRKRFTSAEVVRMMDFGLFEGKRYELIDGDLIDKMGQNPPHASVVRKVQRVLLRICGDDRVLVQQPIEAAVEDRVWSTPEPDVAVLKAVGDEEFEQRHPRGDELVLVVEVSDTTARHDSTTKRDLYARAGVPEYWVVDVTRRLLRVHRDLSNAAFGEITEIRDGSLTVVCATGVMIPVTELLPRIR